MVQPVRAEETATDVALVRRLLPRSSRSGSTCPSQPCAQPVPLAKGAAGETYPYPWSVVRWLDGETPRPGAQDDGYAARGLGGFVRALHAIATSDGPRPGKHNHWRGVPLRERDAQMRQRFEWLADLEDIGARGKNDTLAQEGRRVIDSVLADHQR